MPLPAALAARLAKRGIIHNQPKSRSGQVAAEEPKEEVFAESYDNDDKGDRGRGSGSNATITSATVSSNLDTLDTGFPGCPNKWNVYHSCVLACQHRWGAGKITPDPEYAEKHKKMMAKYGPLPEGWREQYDPGTGRHYYWCMRTDRVAWLPPGHPKAKLTEAASQIREMVQLQEDEDDEDSDEDSNDSGDDEDEAAMDLDSDSDEEDRRRRRDRERRDRDRHDRRGSDRDRGGGRDRRDDRDKDDPMDPSSYSDAPKGAWSRGLAQSQDRN